MTRYKKVHLLTGGNLGDRMATLREAQRLVEKKIGQVVKASSFYETEAWGNVNQPDYLNQALEVATSPSPLEVLHTIFEIEAALGRTRRNKWEARSIDIDILFYNNKIMETKELTIPHPHLHRRNFALIPMLEIAPLKKHPVFKKTIEELYLESEDPLDVFLLESTGDSEPPLTPKTPEITPTPHHPEVPKTPKVPEEPRTPDIPTPTTVPNAPEVPVAPEIPQPLKPENLRQ
jgi:2-amino-4-hydroxy-6-hydroxymethyldihydropteridine diphosphokinase